MESVYIPFMEQLIFYGGKLMTRRECIEQMRKEGQKYNCIDYFAYCSLPATDIAIAYYRNHIEPLDHSSTRYMQA